VFFSLNRKIIYSIIGLFFVSSVVFVLAFYGAYSSKIEADQRASILRNQQYADLLYRNVNLVKELKFLLREHPEISFDKDNYPQVNDFVLNAGQAEVWAKEQKLIEERNIIFSNQYRVINEGVMIIGVSAIVLSLVIVFLGGLIRRWVLVPVSQIAGISEEVSRGNLEKRIKQRSGKLYDEFDSLAATFNMMLDNLQKMIRTIRDKEKFLQDLIDSIPDGIRVIDENYNIVLANKAYYGQVKSNHRKHKKCFCAMSAKQEPCDAAKEMCPLREILLNGKTSVNVIQQLVKQKNKYVAITAAPLITDQKQKCIVEAVRDLSRDIDFSHQQKVSSLSFLSSSIAHEMKNYLGALRIFTEHFIDKYYSDEKVDIEQRKMLEMIHDELINVIKVPERLLKLSRASSNASDEIEVVEAVEDVLRLMDFEAKSKGIDIRFEHSQKEFVIKGNDTDFKIAVINIVLNAINAMPDKGVLQIRLKAKKSGNICLSFEDNGIGIDKDSLSKIFNPFFYNNHQGKAGAGSGLGLAITKSIVERCGGSIEVKSELGKGSCFTLCFLQKEKNLQKNKSGIINKTI